VTEAAAPRTADDGKSLFDFMPNRPAEDPTDLERPQGEPAEPELLERVMDAIRTVRDPEIPVNLVDLGLIYDLAVTRQSAYVEMTLTAPSCPVAGSLPGQVADAIRKETGLQDVRVKLVWTPPWHKGLMSEEALLELGLL
jgi:metal-sulfur cluster biosynthetic enzyme